MFLDYDSLDKPKHAKIIDLREVMLRTGYGKTKIYGLIKKNRFPPQANRLDGSCSAGWYEDEVDLYIESGRNNRSQKWKEAVDVVGIKNRAGTSDVTQGSTPRNEKVTKSKYARVATADVQLQEQGLIATGLELFGRMVYLHRPSGKLLLDVGQALAPLLSQIFAEQAIDQPALGSE